MLLTSFCILLLYLVIVNKIPPFYFVTKQPESTNWKVAEMPTKRLGDKRDEVITQIDDEYGEGNWRFAWKHGANYLNFLEACAVYEKGYEEHFKEHPEKLDYLSKNASELYDTQESNVQSGGDYLKQEDSSTHLQDIAIRRIMAQQGIPFKGDHLIQIRGEKKNPDDVGRLLTPFKVPFHEPDEVLTDKTKPTIEDFWQCNRVIQFCDDLCKVTPSKKH